jgi:hypothetical protein
MPQQTPVKLAVTGSMEADAQAWFTHSVMTLVNLAAASDALT